MKRLMDTTGARVNEAKNRITQLPELSPEFFIVQVLSNYLNIMVVGHASLGLRIWPLSL